MLYALVDGGSLNNQDPNKRQAYGTFLIVDGPSAFTWVDTTEVARERFEFGNRTNNEAEYLILIECLKYAIQQGMDLHQIATDSALVWGQLNGVYKVGDKKLAALVSEVRPLIIQIGGISLANVPRKTIAFYLGH